MLTIKESVEQIKTQIIDLFGIEATDVRLEEIGKSTNEIYNITVSFLIPNKNLPDNTASVCGITIFPYDRQYKQLKVNKKDGNIISMKMHRNA
ncbi:MAG: hypothetical protein FWG98_07085 [Candidatus Cloacimonetes bacterium]|nr:hypothetical protein [Candidatus Cloacimonadota bacterium]